MTEADELPYLVAREKISRELARESGDVSVRSAHVAIADGYAERIRTIRLGIIV